MDEAEKLKKRIKELEEEVKLFEEEVKLFEEEVKRLRKIEEEFKEFKAKHNQTVAELRKAPKIKANKTKITKPIGAKNGHKGYARHIPERIDQIKVLNLKICPHCKTKLGETQEIRQRYVTDIKLIPKVKNTRYDIHRKYCRYY